MKACRGIKAGDIWFDRMYNGDDDVEQAKFPSTERLAKREDFFQSLARAMAELRTLEFDKIGTLDFDFVDSDGNPSIGPCWHWRIDPDTVTGDLDTDKVLRQQPVCESSQDLFLQVLRNTYGSPAGGRIRNFVR